MGGLMIYFIANLLPVFCMVWALSLLLFFNTLFTDEYPSDNEEVFSNILPPLAIFGAVILFIILPIRTCINKCVKPDTPLDIDYKDVFE